MNTEDFQPHTDIGVAMHEALADAIWKERYGFGHAFSVIERAQGNWGTALDDSLEVTESLHRRMRGSWAPRRGLPRWLRDAVMQKHSYTCLYCGKRAEEIDHVVPRARGGSDHEDNLAAACWLCNSHKRSRYIWEWIRRNPAIDADAIRQRWRVARGDLELRGLGA